MSRQPQESCSKSQAKGAPRADEAAWKPGIASGQGSCREGPAPPGPRLAPAHRTGSRRSNLCSHTRSCTWRRWGSCSGWGPRPSLGTLLLPPERQSGGLGQGPLKPSHLALGVPRPRRGGRGLGLRLGAPCLAPKRPAAHQYWGDGGVCGTKGSHLEHTLGTKAGAQQGAKGTARRVSPRAGISGGPGPSSSVWPSPWGLGDQKACSSPSSVTPRPPEGLPWAPSHPCFRSGT